MTDLASALAAVVGDAHVLTEPAAQQRFLRDFSWYSPVLTEAFGDTRIDAVVQPGSLDELAGVVQVGVQQRVPITVRGAVLPFPSDAAGPQHLPEGTALAGTMLPEDLPQEAVPLS